MITVNDQIALITGGSRGIGAATARLLAQAGANVVIAYEKNNRAADEVVTQIEAMGRNALALKCKVQSTADCKRVVTKTIEQFKRIDILVNNAGVWEPGTIGTMTEAQWKQTIDINLTGTFNMCNAVAPIMKKQKYGRIVNVSSTAGQRGEAFHSQYGTSKGGVIAFTKSIAVELIPHNIWVNCVAPGWVETEMIDRAWNDPTSRKEILKTIPRGKIASPEEIAGPILFLCSPLANHIVGEVLNVNGGSVLCG